jgi:hypothetical protein
MNKQIKFPAGQTLAAYGRNGTFKASGLDIVRAGDSIRVANLTSKGKPAIGHIALPLDPDALREFAATLEQLASDISQTGKPHYLRQFPDFEPDSLPYIPPEWVDISWHNDACPSWQVKESTAGDVSQIIKVWIDYKTESLRESPDGKRFCISFERFNGSEMIVHNYMESDVWQEIINIVPDYLDMLESE